MLEGEQGLPKYQSNTEQNHPFASISLSSVVVLTIPSRMVPFIMGNPATNKIISPDTKQLIDQLLLEGIS